MVVVVVVVVVGLDVVVGTYRMCESGGCLEEHRHLGKESVGWKRLRVWVGTCCCLFESPRAVCLFCCAGNKYCVT